MQGLEIAFAVLAAVDQGYPVIAAPSRVCDFIATMGADAIELQKDPSAHSGRDWIIVIFTNPFSDGTWHLLKPWS